MSKRYSIDIYLAENAILIHDKPGVLSLCCVKSPTGCTQRSTAFRRRIHPNLSLTSKTPPSTKIHAIPFFPDPLYDAIHHTA